MDTAKVEHVGIRVIVALEAGNWPRHNWHTPTDAHILLHEELSAPGASWNAPFQVTFNSLCRHKTRTHSAITGDVQ